MVLAGQQGGGGQMIKKFAPWIIGTIILLSASSICSYFLDGLSFEIAMADTPHTEAVSSLPYCRLLQFDKKELNDNGRNLRIRLFNSRPQSIA